MKPYSLDSLKFTSEKRRRFGLELKRNPSFESFTFTSEKRRHFDLELEGNPMEKSPEANETEMPRKDTVFTAVSTHFVALINVLVPSQGGQR